MREKNIVTVSRNNYKNDRGFPELPRNTKAIKTVRRGISDLSTSNNFEINLGPAVFLFFECVLEVGNNSGVFEKEEAEKLYTELTGKKIFSLNEVLRTLIRKKIILSIDEGYRVNSKFLRNVKVNEIKNGNKKPECYWTKEAGFIKTQDIPKEITEFEPDMDIF